MSSIVLVCLTFPLQPGRNRRRVPAGHRAATLGPDRGRGEWPLLRPRGGAS